MILVSSGDRNVSEAKNDEIRIDILYGFIRMDTIWRQLPDGSMQRGCHVRTYDNPPSQPENLASEKIEWGMILPVECVPFLRRSARNGDHP